jgi:hypothetical protein
VNPKQEFSELVDRSGSLVNSVLLLLVSLAHLFVSIGTLFCTVFITVFVFGRGIADRMTARVSAHKTEEMLNVL